MRPLVRGKDRLPDAQAQIRLPAQVGVVRGRPGDHPLEFLEERVRVFEAARRAVASKPLGKVTHAHLPALGHTQARQVFRERQETDVLGVVGIRQRIVQRAGIVHQIGGAGHIQDLARRVFHFLEGQGGLATAGRPDHDAGRGERVDRLLGVVERHHLMEEMEGGQPRIQIRQWCRGGLVRMIHDGDFALVDGRTTA